MDNSIEYENITQSEGTNSCINRYNISEINKNFTFKGANINNDIEKIKQNIEK